MSAFDPDAPPAGEASAGTTLAVHTAGGNLLGSSDVTPGIRDLTIIANEPSVRNVSITEEHIYVQASRLRREEDDAKELRWRNRVKLIAYLCALFGAGVICAGILLFSASDELQTKAFTALVALVSGSVGFLAGEKAIGGSK